MKRNKYLKIVVFIFTISSTITIYSCKTSKSSTVQVSETDPTIQNKTLVSNETSTISSANSSFTSTVAYYNKPINFVKNPSGRGNDEVVFYDTLTKAVLKTLKLKDENPYTNLNYKKADEANYQGNPVYLVNNKPLKEVMPTLDLKHYTDSTGERLITSLTSYHNAIEFNKYVIEMFELRAFSGELRAASMSSIFIYDSIGNLKSQISNIGTNVLDIEMTENGKFLTLQYGIDEEDYGNILKVGVSVFNTTNNILIFDNYDGSPGFFCKNNLVFIGRTINHNSKGNEVYKKINVYNFDNNLMYSREFTRAETGRILDVSGEGYILKNTDGSTTVLYYNEQFKVEKL